MSKYAEKNLAVGESIVVKAKHSVLCVLGHVIWCIALIVAVVFVRSAFKPSDAESDTVSFIPDALVDPILWGLAFLAGVLPLLIRVFTVLSENLVITNRRIFGKRGILRLDAVDYPISRVDSVEVKAGVVGNLLHYYNVTVRTSSNFEKPVKFIGIKNANAVKNGLTIAIERNAEENRLKLAKNIAEEITTKNAIFAPAPEYPDIKM